MYAQSNRALALETESQAVYTVHRSLLAPLLGLVVCLGFVSFWLLEHLQGIGAEFLLSLGFSAFVLLAVLPAAALMVCLILIRDPVIAVFGPSVWIASPSLPWRKTVLSVDDILAIETDWSPGTSRARIVFHVTPACFAGETRSGPWIIRKNDRLILDVLNTDSTPAEIAANLRRCLGLTENS